MEPIKNKGFTNGGLTQKGYSRFKTNSFLFNDRLTFTAEGPSRGSDRNAKIIRMGV